MVSPIPAVAASLVPTYLEAGGIGMETDLRRGGAGADILAHMDRSDGEKSDEEEVKKR